MNDSLDVRAQLAGKNVLVTGTTGFLGKVFVSLLLSEVPDIGVLQLLVRGRPARSAVERVEHLLAHHPALRPLRAKHGVKWERFVGERVAVVQGDVSLEGCGLSAEDLWRAREADVVVHFAGLTDFEPSPRAALGINVRGAMNAAELASKTRGKRLVHVSTCFVAGARSGVAEESVARGVTPNGAPFDPLGIAEELLVGCDRVDAELGKGHASEGKKRKRELGGEVARKHGFQNLYTLSKAMGEQAVVAQRGVRIAIVRPSIVESARAFPMPGWNEGIDTSGPLVGLLSTAFRAFPARAQLHFDVVPVDDVARAIVLVTAAQLEGTADGVYQAASGDVNPLTMGRAVELTNLAVRKHHARAEATAFERLVLRHLDTYVADDDDLLATHRVRKLATRAREALDGVEATGFAKKLLDRVQSKLASTDRDLDRIEKLLAIYRPFVRDFDVVFRTERLRALAERVVPEQRAALGFDMTSLDWRRYWLDVQVPGLVRWCLPLLRGERPPEDPGPPVKLAPRATLASEVRA